MGGRGPSAGPDGWFVRPQRAGAAGESRCRLFCFPGAGGVPGNFHGWESGFPETVELWLARLPGRESRAAEPLPGSIRDLAEILAGIVAPALDRPFALFGYSMGGTVAYELALALLARGLPPPRHLFAAASRSPLQPRALPPIHALPSEAFWQALTEDDRPPADAAILAELEPRLRSDLRLLETYRPPVEPQPLACPITVFGGREDRLLDLEDLALWQGVSGAGCEIVVLDGGHGFAFEASAGAELRLRIRQALGA
ncbi:Surfactin synthase thioesterase subunit [Tistlia consotensis]|uniref:Surfactin synthase thioesterase subunit n=1 Tax=Tistlia consotensis USBA 355 TaxID=560819 RepID=A0A1Y6B4Z6_9PROT|nr:alpha/beta fold hydrolase [Tistlia consotensis]SME90635.1 Surfactin synthase thioesterase subunit [Tistlia consotensis USBA 355]SNR26845.1 Surfactin synthase thioesterase subunit [Tistlia consotensis]